LNRLMLFLAIALCAVPAALSAQDLRVEYLDGLLEAQSGGRWRPVLAGETIAADTLRLSQGALAQLSAGGLQVTLHQPGSYAVGALLRSSRQSLAWGLGRLLRTKIQALFSAPAGNLSESSGARAGEVRDSMRGLEMMEDEEEEARKAAARAEQAAAAEVEGLLAQGRAGEAATAAVRALEQAGDEGRPYLLFLLASALCLEGDYAGAVRALETAAVPEAAPYYGEFALLEARLLLEGQAFGRALAAFDRLLASSPKPGVSQQAWFLSAFCSLQLGDKGQARRRLEKARDLDERSEIGSKAKAMLNNL
jgi:tetratricopeptide (TPR) repeat protein